MIAFTAYIISSYWSQLVTPGHSWSHWSLSRSGTFTMMALMDIKAPLPLIRNCPEEEEEEQEEQEEQESEKCVTC